MSNEFTERFRIVRLWPGIAAIPFKTSWLEPGSFASSETVFLFFSHGPVCDFVFRRW